MKGGGIFLRKEWETFYYTFHPISYIISYLNISFEIYIQMTHKIVFKQHLGQNRLQPINRYVSVKKKY